MAEYVLENKWIQATVRTKSAELISLRRKEDGREYLWNADPKFWEWTSPILFPVVGGLRDKQYRYQGNTYTMGQHGFARFREFQVISYQPEEIWMCLEDDADSYQEYPFHFRLEIGYLLAETSVRVMWRVVNKEEKKMYFSIGGHPAILCPPDKKGSRIGCGLGFETEKGEMDYLLVDPKTQRISSEVHKLPLEDKMHRIFRGMFDYDALIFENWQVKTAFFADSDGKPYIKMHTQAPISAFWSPKEEAPFICFEPWYGRGDGVDFEGTLEERAWGQSLEAHGVFEGGYELEIIR